MSEEGITICRLKEKNFAYIDRKAQANANSTCDSTFARAIWTKNHVHAGTRGELHEIVCKKVLAANSKYRAGQVTRSISNESVS
jgi:hypothetical protein